MPFCAEGEHALLSATCLFVAPPPAERGIKSMFVESLPQRLRLHDVRVDGRTEAEGIDASLKAVLIDVNENFDVSAFGDLLSKLVHFAELPRGIHMQERERNSRRPERLPRQMEKNGRVLPHGVEKHGPSKLCRGFAKDVDRLGLEQIQVGETADWRRIHDC